MDKNKNYKVLIFLSSFTATIFCLVFIFVFTQPRDNKNQAIQKVLGTSENIKTPSTSIIDIKQPVSRVSPEKTQKLLLEKLKSQPDSPYQARSPDNLYTAFILDNLLLVQDNNSKEIVLKRESSELKNAIISTSYPQNKNLFTWLTNSQLKYPVWSELDGRYVSHLLSVKSVRLDSSNN